MRNSADWTFQEIANYTNIPLATICYICIAPTTTQKYWASYCLVITTLYWKHMIELATLNPTYQYMSWLEIALEANVSAQYHKTITTVFYLEKFVCRIAPTKLFLKLINKHLYYEIAIQFLD